MKRFACTLLCGALLLTFAGCGKEETKELTEKETAQTTAESVKATEETKAVDLDAALAGYEILWTTTEELADDTADKDALVADFSSPFAVRFKDATDTAMLMQRDGSGYSVLEIWCRKQHMEFEQNQDAEGKNHSVMQNTNGMHYYVVPTDDFTLFYDDNSYQRAHAIFTDHEHFFIPGKVERSGVECYAFLRVENDALKYSFRNCKFYPAQDYAPYLENATSLDELETENGTVSFENGALVYTPVNVRSVEENVTSCYDSVMRGDFGKDEKARYGQYGSLDGLLEHNRIENEKEA